MGGAGFFDGESPKKGDLTGPNPTDRAKSGVKIHVLTDQRGIPLSVGITGANVNDHLFTGPALDGIRIRAPRGPRRPVNLCMDKGYDYASVDLIVRSKGVCPHIRRRGEDPLLGSPRRKPKRWVVERTISWLQNFRGIRTRWDRKGKNYYSMLLFASALLVYKRSL
jgi:transposase